MNDLNRKEDAEFANEGRAQNLVLLQVSLIVGRSLSREFFADMADGRSEARACQHSVMI